MEKRDMTGVDEIEAPVREYDPVPLCPPFFRQGPRGFDGKNPRVG